jgi:hypothetical protein
MSTGRFFESVSGGLESLAPSLGILAVLTLGIAILAGAWGVRQLRTTPAILLAASNLVIVGWLLLFWKHTVIHGWFMDRIFAWTIASGFALFAMALIGQARDRQSTASAA